MSIKIKSLGCHIGCSEVTGGEHATEVTKNDRGRWLAECSTCGTVLRGFSSYGLAVTLALRHALDKTVIT